MSKGEVIAFLEEHKGKWFETKKIEAELNYRSVNANLASLYKNESERIMHNLERRDRREIKGYEWRIRDEIL